MGQTDTPSTNDITRDALISRLARRVREVRRQKAMPRRIVSELSGVSPRYLAQLEAGQGNISIALLERVARALDVPIEALIAQQISIDPEAHRVARLYEQANEETRAKVKAVLLEPQPVAGLRTGRICLMGLRGAGKTTLGTLAANALGVPFVELSNLIEEETGMPLAEVLSLYGADGYRRLEADALNRVIERPGPLLLSVSGGLVEQEAAFARLLERFHTVWLRTSPAVHVERVRAQGQLQPIKDEPLAVAQIRSLMAVRTPLYARAEAELDTTDSDPKRSLQQLLALVREKKFLGNRGA